MKLIDKLINKKVKAHFNNYNYSFTDILEKLKENNIHTLYLERQKAVHSLFFISENETSFLPLKDISDSEFKHSPLEEIDVEEFIDILGMTSKLNKKDDLGLDNLLNKNPSFLNWDNGEVQAVMNIDKIVYASYKDNTISVHMTDGYIVNINNIDDESYYKFCKILMS